MDHQNHIINLRKNKHLNRDERVHIQIRLNDGYSRYKIAKELNRPINTISNEIRRGMTAQIKGGKSQKVYLAERGQAVYDKNRSNSCRTLKYLKCASFISYAMEKMKNNSWSPDACVGNAILNKLFEPSEMVCTKTLYNYIDLDLMTVKNIHLPMKLRRGTKAKRLRENKRILGNSIENRPPEVDTREQFGDWEIDSIIGEKSNGDNTLLTLVERKTRYTLALKVAGKTVKAVTDAIDSLRELYGENFSQIFKSITSDNGTEFSNLSDLEKETATRIYFTHPYSSYERGTNERHNGLIRRFIPKGTRISNYDIYFISSIEEWMNTLPRKILGYKTPEELFEEQLDKIYAA